MSLLLVFLITIPLCVSYGNVFKHIDSLRLKHSETIKYVYTLSNGELLWTDPERLERLKNLLESSRWEGLNPEDYRVPYEENPIKRDVLYTYALISYVLDLSRGKVRPDTSMAFFYERRVNSLDVDKIFYLITSDRLEDIPKEFSPPYEGYWNLKRMLKVYEDIREVGGWEKISTRRIIKRGYVGPEVHQIRKRLYITMDLEELKESDVYDEVLEEAVRRFQARHGLPPSGVVDKQTLRAMNVSVDERIATIRLNMDRFRWLHQNHNTFVLVNIPSFELFFVRNSKLVLRSKVIVGRNYKDDFRPTPIIVSSIESITLNPKWYVPQTIATKDILPKVRKDPTYLTRQGIKVYIDGEEVDPALVDWSSDNLTNLRFIQDPGEKNSLGRIKFNFPNPFAVYLHDTPHKSLFKRHIKSFSSGCIRVEKAKELAREILRINNYSDGRIDNLQKVKDTIGIRLSRPVPIMVVYFTAYADDKQVYFWQDIYSYDRMLLDKFSWR